MRVYKGTAIRDYHRERKPGMNHTIHVAKGHKTRGIVSFLLVAFSFTWPFFWWLAVLAHLIV